MKPHEGVLLENTAAIAGGLSLLLFGRGLLKRLVSIERGNTEQQHAPKALALDWIGFWRKWVPVWGFLSALLFERLSVFPADIRPAIVRLLLLPVGPIWALFLWRSRPMGRTLFFANFVLGAAWCLAIAMALLFWFDPEARPLDFQVIPGPIPATEAQWMATQPMAWDLIQLGPQEGFHHTYTRVIVSNRSEHSVDSITISFTLGEFVRIFKTALRLTPYSSVAPSSQRWMWRQVAAPAESAGIPGGFCADRPSGDSWSWCKVVGAAPTHTVRLQIRRLEPRQAGTLYIYGSSGNTGVAG